MWKKCRLAAAEQRLLTQQLKMPVDILEKAPFKLLWRDNVEHVLPHLEDLDSSLIPHFKKQLSEVSQFWAHPASAALLAQWQQQSPDFYQTLSDTAGVHLGVAKPTVSQLLTGYVTRGDGSSAPVLKVVLDHLAE